MKIALICALEEESAGILAQVPLTARRTHEYGHCQYTEYDHDQHQVLMTVCGIGKVNAAIATQTLISKFAVDAVINVGVAGSLSTQLTFGDVVLADDLVQHDFDVTAFGSVKGQIARMNTFSFLADANLNKLLIDDVVMANNKIMLGRIVSGDQFIDDAITAKRLAREFNALACEMEGAAVAHVCHVNKVPFAVVRSVSDMAGQDGQASKSFDDLKEMAASRAALMVENLFKRL